MTEERPVRQPSAVDRVAEDWVSTLVDLDPTIATYIGVAGRTGEYGDTSPAGAEAMASAARAATAALDAAAPVDDVDRVTKTDLGAELELVVESYDRRLHLRDLNVIASPPQAMRDAIDLMPTATESDWHDIASRFAAMPDALEGYREILLQGTREQVTPARRQVELVAEQAARSGAADGFFRQLADTAATEDGVGAARVAPRRPAPRGRCRRGRLPLVQPVPRARADAARDPGRRRRPRRLRAALPAVPRRGRRPRRSVRVGDRGTRAHA